MIFCVRVGMKTLCNTDICLMRLNNSGLASYCTSSFVNVSAWAAIVSTRHLRIASATLTRVSASPFARAMVLVA